jgi:carboxypeptidase Taq
VWEAARAALPDLESRLAAGDSSGLLAWLRENVHSHGRRLDPPELLRRATGQDLNPEPQLSYLREKYGELYGL